MSAFAKSSANELKVWQLQLKRHFHSHPVALRQFTFIEKLRCCLAGYDKYFSVIDPYRHDHEPVNFNLYLVLAA